MLGEFSLEEMLENAGVSHWQGIFNGKRSKQESAQ